MLTRIFNAGFQYLLTGKAEATLPDLMQANPDTKVFKGMLEMAGGMGVSAMNDETFEGLEENGKQKLLTEANKNEWVKRQILVQLYERPQRQLDALRQGFTQACARVNLWPLLPQLLSFADLRTALCGEATVTPEALNRVLRFEGLPQVFQENFRAAIAEMTPKELATLVFYATGSYSIPVREKFEIKICAKLPTARHLPSAHTCFFSLDVHQSWNKVCMFRCFRTV